MLLPICGLRSSLVASSGLCRKNACTWGPQRLDVLEYLDTQGAPLSQRRRGGGSREGLLDRVTRMGEQQLIGMGNE